MALLPRTPPPRKGYSHYITNAVFSSVYICEKPTSLAYKVEKHFQDKPIIALKNFGKWIRKKQSLFSTGSPGERKYASSSLIKSAPTIGKQPLEKKEQVPIIRMRSCGFAGSTG